MFVYRFATDSSGRGRYVLPPRGFFVQRGHRIQSLAPIGSIICDTQRRLHQHQQQQQRRQLQQQLVLFPAAAAAIAPPPATTAAAAAATATAFDDITSTHPTSYDVSNRWQSLPAVELSDVVGVHDDYGGQEEAAPSDHLHRGAAGEAGADVHADPLSGRAAARTAGAHRRPQRGTRRGKNLIYIYILLIL